jgi:signal transduction histidine kinase/streptogramin lyase
MIKYLLGVFLLVSAPFGTHAQIPEWEFRYFTQQDGLSNTFVTSWAQDSIGFVWVGTVNGLNRYDGGGFKAYFSNHMDSSMLPHQHVSHLFVHSSGLLWVVTKRGIVTYNRKTDSFNRVPIENFEPTENFEVSHIDTDKNGRIFISRDNELYRFDDKDNILRLYATLSEGGISRFIFDSENRIYIGLVEGGKILRFNEQLTSRRVIVPNPEIGNDYSPVNAMVWYNNQLLVGLLRGGNYAISSHNQSVTPLPVNLPDTYNSLFLSTDRLGNIWSIDYTGLKLFNPIDRSYYGFYPVPNNPKSIRNSITGIFQDNQNNYWCTYRNGVLGLHSQSKGFRNISNLSSDYWKLSGTMVNTLTEDGQGNMWFGMEPSQLTVFWHSQGRIENYYGKDGKFAFQSGTVRYLYRDVDDNVWLSTYNGGLQWLDVQNSRFVAYKNNPGDTTSLMNNDVVSIADDREGNLWLAMHGMGVDKFNKKTKKVEHFTAQANNLANPWTNHVIVDRKGRVWVATVWGLSMLPKGSKQFRKYLADPNDSLSLISSNVLTVFETLEGDIWVGTDQGLNKYNEGTETFSRLNSGLSSNTISAILDDNIGYLWVSTLSGISQIHKKTLSVTNFYEPDGILDGEFVLNSAYKSEQGHLFFGNINGVTVIDPDKIRFNEFVSPLVITSIDVDGRSLDDYRDNVANIDKDYSLAGHIKLSHHDKIVTINYAGLGFNNSSRQRYKVRLAGFDKEWRDMGAQTQVSYNYLPPNEYVLHIVAANNDGKWNPIETRLFISVLPPWYGTTLFKVIAFVILMLLVYLFVWLRTRQLHLQRVSLSIQVQKRTEELHSANQELMAQADYLDSLNKDLREKQQKVESQAKILAVQTEALRKGNRDLKQLNSTKDRLFSIIAHDLLNPFTSIMGISELLNVDYDSLDDNERKQLTSTIHTSSSRLFNLLQNLLLWARSQTSAIKFDQQTFPVHEVLEEATEHFRDQLTLKKMNFSIVCDPSLCVYADVDMVKTIFRNLVNNAIKFTPSKGTIGMIVTPKKGYAEIAVMDTGIGMDEETAAMLFDPASVKTSIGTDGETGTGLGLIICKEFVERNKGSIEVNSILGAGTTFTVKLPLSAF